MAIAGPLPQLRLDWSHCETNPVKSIVASGLPMLATLVWVAALIVDPGDLFVSQVLLLGLGWLLLTTVGTVGLLLVGGRWAQRTLIAATMIGFYVALFRPLGTYSVIGLAVTGAALVVLLAPQLGPRVRQLPAADGPPKHAVAAMLVPLGLPALLGLVQADSNGWVLLAAVLGPCATFLYARTIPGGLVAIRFGLPLVVLVLAVPMGMPHGVIAVLVVAVGTALAWRPDVAVAFHPVVEKGTSFAIPPELAPKEILDGAGIDETGKRR